MTKDTKRTSHLKAVSPANLVELSDECPKCFGTGMEIVPGKGARKCSCRGVKKSVDHLELAGIPKRYDACHINNFKATTPLQRQALKFATTFAHEFPATDRGLLLMGNVGVGKTHLGVSILKLIAERGFSCKFYEFGALLKEIQSTYNPQTDSSEISVLSPVLQTDVLLLDELGASKPTSWVMDTLYHIINTRYNNKKATIFTTNFYDDRIDARREILEDRVGVAVRSRLFEMCRTVIIDGVDHRRTLDNHTLSAV